MRVRLLSKKKKVLLKLDKVTQERLLNIEIKIIKNSYNVDRDRIKMFAKFHGERTGS